MMSFRDYIISLIKEEQNKRVKSILDKNSHFCHSVCTSGYSLLHCCALYNNEKIAQYLLMKGSHIDAQDAVGRTPLMIAVQADRTEVAKILLAAGANIDVVLNDRKRLILAEHRMSTEFQVVLLTEFRKQFNTSEETAERLMDAGCHLYQAVCLKDVRIIKFMLDQGYPVHSMHPENKLTALHFAVSFEDVEIVRLLLEYGADATALDNMGRTPLHYVYYPYRVPYSKRSLHNREKVEILKIFFDSGILTTSCMSEAGIFQISNILIDGGQKAVRLVLQSYPDFTAKDEGDGGTMLHYLAINDNPEVIEELKLHIDKFNVNAVDNWGSNPLCWAVKNNNVDMAEFLLEHGAAVNSAYYVTEPPALCFALDIPSNFKSNRCIELLLQHNENAQFIFSSPSETSTIFDVTPVRNRFDRIKRVIAHLAMLEQLGTLITEITWSKINAMPSLKKYFNRCRQVLNAEICGTVTVFKLLTDDVNKIATYLNCKELNSKLERISYKRKLKSSFPYYYNTVRKRIAKGCSRKTLKDNTATIFCNISERRLDKGSLILDRIIDYLNDQDLQNLYHVYR